MSAIQPLPYLNPQETGYGQRTNASDEARVKCQHGHYDRASIARSMACTSATACRVPRPFREHRGQGDGREEEGKQVKERERERERERPGHHASSRDSETRTTSGVILREYCEVPRHQGSSCYGIRFSQVLLGSNLLFPVERLGFLLKTRMQLMLIRTYLGQRNSKERDFRAYQGWPLLAGISELSFNFCFFLLLSLCVISSV